MQHILSLFVVLVCLSSVAAAREANVAHPPPPPGFLQVSEPDTSVVAPNVERISARLGPPGQYVYVGGSGLNTVRDSAPRVCILKSHQLF